MKLALVTLTVFLLNIPFGYWRANVRKFSMQWILAIHIPVLVIIALRMYTDLGFAWHTYVFMVAAFFLGQKAGSFISEWMRSRYGLVGSFLFCDLICLKKSGQ
ncbi:MAG TPA: hypothetical protein DD458_21595 [Prolixibacteraceae bacterium]|nr:hypothetical protein [Prolixibacteraceae bacterium]HCR90915.1 hypothetical protein [Prolixibacteraceae bacterium]HCU63312.1 hypothetical protein [Prolixibacteraceae bacterium]